MGLLAKNEGGGGDRKLMEAGTYIARCVWVIDLGNQLNNFNKKVHTALFGFEFPTEKEIFSKDYPEPFFLSKEYTLSTHEKSNLRKMLKGWRGSDLTATEIEEGFDVTKLNTVPAYISVSLTPNKDGSKMYNNIESIISIPKELPIPEQINPSKVFVLDKFDETIFEGLPSFIKEKIQKSTEYLALIQQSMAPQNQGPSPVNEQISNKSMLQEISNKSMPQEVSNKSMPQEVSKEVKQGEDPPF